MGSCLLPPTQHHSFFTNLPPETDVVSRKLKAAYNQSRETKGAFHSIKFRFQFLEIGSNECNSIFR